jgi:hypothetical protein
VNLKVAVFYRRISGHLHAWILSIRHTRKFVVCQIRVEEESETEKTKSLVKIEWQFLGRTRGVVVVKMVDFSLQGLPQ